jgi:3,4-dihydroxy-2-butanone 4-phosphate synthase/GTP cyclohydrolase II
MLRARAKTMRAAPSSALRRIASTRMPTKWGMFHAIGFERDVANGTRRVETALAIVMGDLTQGIPLLRIHSQCFTGEVLGSLRCDCRDQLEMAMQAIAEEGRGVVIYEYQEGRSIGLMAKLQAYELQDAGLDTVDANHVLGFKSDCRDFSLPAAILSELRIRRVRLMSNNPRKTQVLRDAGIEVVEELPCEAEPTMHSLGYLKTKKEKLGHTLSLCERLGTDAKTQRGDIHHDEEFVFGTIEAAIEELKAGRMIVVVDDEDRENEGDLTMAAEMVTPQAINFMAMYGRGLICLAMTGERLDELDLTPMVRKNTATCGTGFTVSIDLKGHGVTTGVSAYDRAETIKAAIDPTSVPTDFARPGHIFPLRARDGGVLERRGQTEAAVDLASLAGLKPAGVICEILNDDGTMARLPDLARFCKKHGLLMINVAELARYRVDSDFEGAVAALDGMFPVCRPAPAQWVSDASDLF